MKQNPCLTIFNKINSSMVRIKQRKEQIKPEKNNKLACVFKQCWSTKDSPKTNHKEKINRVNQRKN